LSHNSKEIANQMIVLHREYDVGTARQTAIAVAEKMGFDALAVGEINLAVSEIAQNVIKYAETGNVLIACSKNNRVLTVTVTDHGPGIANIEMAMREGYSTLRNSLGLGLESAQRLMDSFEINTAAGEGTMVVMEKYLPFMTNEIEYGLVSVSDEDYNFNGDDYVLKEYNGDEVIIGVIDGAGQGYNAYAISSLMKKFIHDNYAYSLESLVLSCHELLLNSELTNGATISLAKISPTKIIYLGVGDTHSYLINREIKCLSNFDGRVGAYQLGTIKAAEYELQQPAVLVMCTDGISTNLELDHFIETIETAQEIAKSIFNKHHKPYGDVTVLITKIKSLL